MKPKENKVHCTPQDCSFVPTLAVTLWLGWNGGLILLLIYLVFLATPLQRNVIIGILTLSSLLPASFPKKLGTKFGGWVAHNAIKYFGMKVTIEDERSLEAVGGKGPIFALEPHDILPYYCVMFNGSLDILPSNLRETAQVLMTGAIFKIPIMKHVYSYMGGAPVDKKTFKKKLQNGETVIFIPGGVQEVLLLDPNNPEELVLFLQNRKGFVKLALENGSPIIPAFAFHAEGSYDSWIPRGKFFEKISRSIGFLPLFFTGRYCIPLGIPKPVKIHIVIGKPIEVPRLGQNIEREDVKKYHDKFLQEMKNLFERHKHSEEGYGSRSLKIM